MHWIDEATVRQVWQDVARFDAQRATDEMMRLGEEQPQLLGYAMAMWDELSEEARELAIYMLFVIYRIFETGYHQPLPQVSLDGILAHDHDVEQMMLGLEDADEETVAKAAIGANVTQPWIIQYIVETLLEAPETDDAVVLTDEENGRVFLVLKAVVDALNEVTDEPSESDEAYRGENN